MSDNREENLNAPFVHSPAETRNVLPPFHYTGPVSPEGLEEIREWTRRIHHSASVAAEGAPFMVVTPLGIPRRDDLAGWLLAHGYAIRRRTVIPDWAAASTVLYPRTEDDERLTVALGFHALWTSVCPDLKAERWDLGSAEDIQRLSAEKVILRQVCGSLRYQVNMPTVTFHARLQALHVPDPDRYQLESKLLDAACAMTEIPTAFIHA